MVDIIGYPLLANAIIRKASLDYIKILCDEPLDNNPSRNLVNENELQKFFNSEYFMALSSIDGGALMKRLEDEAYEYGYDWDLIKASRGICEDY